MYLLALILIGFVWLFWLATSFRSDSKKIVLLLSATLCEGVGMYLVFQDAVRADELGTSGNIFENPLALLILSFGLLPYAVITVIRLTKGKNPQATPVF